MKRIVSGAKGFTLIELLVVIAIIGVLASVAMTSFGNARIKSRDAKRVSDIKALQTALQLYFDTNGTFPKDIYATGVLSPTYIQTVPTNNGAELPYDPYRVADWADGAAPIAAADLCNTTTPCLGYHLGIDLEENNTNILAGAVAQAGSGSDALILGKYTGTTNHNCGNDAATEYCYDVRNQ